MEFLYDDAGRERKSQNDCVIRALSIVMEKSYEEIDQEIPRTETGRVYREDYHPYLLENGYEWTPTMHIGSGCKVHLRDGELPSGKLIVSCSKHLTAVIDGVIHDTADPSRGGYRCVYGYYRKGVSNGTSFL